jgi:Cys-tRNA(Pro)/Cys-tRNA(Cys) deacylase
MTTKNNVTRMLDAKKIPYTAHPLPQEKLGAQEAAAFLAVDPKLVFKTIVALRPTGGKPILAVLPGDSELDLKALAKALGEKKIKLATHDEAEKITDLQTGGISPIALLNKGFQVIVDESANGYAQIFISGGQRGLNIQLAPKDLIKLTKARLSKIA